MIKFDIIPFRKLTNRSSPVGVTHVTSNGRQVSQQSGTVRVLAGTARHGREAMFTIRVARKGNNNPRPTKAVVEAMLAMIAVRCRVQRPSLLANLLPNGRKVSAFYSLPIMPGDVVNDPAKLQLCGPDHPNYDAPVGKRWMDYTLPIEVDSMGRAKTRQAFENATDHADTIPIAESIRLWVKSWCADVVAPDDLAIVILPAE